MFNLEIESGVYSSLHQERYQQIIYAKLNLKIHYLPQDERDTWHYRYVNTEIIYFLEKDFLQKKMLTKWSIYLLKQLRISSRTLFHAKQCSVMTEIQRGSVAKLKS